MKFWIRHTLSAAVCLLLTGGVVFVSSRIRNEREQSTCHSIEISILGEERFLEPEEVKEFIFRHYGAFIGQSQDSVRLDRMEYILKSHHFVSNCEVWMTGDGVLHLDVLQKTPILRFEHNGSGFYMDRYGEAFPLHESWDAEVPLVRGKIQCREWAEAVIGIMGKCDVSGMEVSDDGSITLHTVRGPESILFGQPERIDSKLELIDTYYNKIKPQKGDYNIVDVKYTGKIFCKI